VIEAVVLRWAIQTMGFVLDIFVPQLFAVLGEVALELLFKVIAVLFVIWILVEVSIFTARQGEWREL
jgi:hypothetical protein